jgi:hypothetical protein
MRSYTSVVAEKRHICFVHLNVSEASQNRNSSSMNTCTSPECVIFEDPLLRDVVTLAMPALVSAGDLLSLTALEMTACIHSIPHDFSVAWQKIMTTSSIPDFIFAYARGYNLDPSNLLKVTDDITISAISFSKKHPEPKNRKYLEDILKDVLDTVLPSGPFEPDDAEIAHDEKYGCEPHIPARSPYQYAKPLEIKA